MSEIDGGNSWSKREMKIIEKAAAAIARVFEIAAETLDHKQMGIRPKKGKKHGKSNAR